MSLDIHNKNISYIVLPTNQLSFNKWIEHVHKEASITRMSGLNRELNRSQATDNKEYLKVKPHKNGFKELSLEKCKKYGQRGKGTSNPPKKH